MALSETFPIRSSMSFPIWLNTRYFTSAGAFFIIISFSDCILKRYVGLFTLDAVGGDHIIADGLITGIVVSTIYSTIWPLLASPRISNRSWVVLFGDFAAIFSAIFVLDATLQTAIYDGQLNPSSDYPNAAVSVLLALFGSPVAVWMMWSAEFQSEVDASNHPDAVHNPHLTIAAALLGTVALFGLLIAVISVERDRGSKEQSHFARITILVSHQEILAEKISNVAQQAAEAKGESRSRLLLSLSSVVTQLNEQSSELWKFVNTNFSRSDSRYDGILRRLEFSVPLREVLVTQAELAHQSLLIGDSVNSALHTASETYVKVLESALIRSDVLGTAAFNKALRTNKLMDIMFPLLLFFILSSIVVPVARIFQSQYSAEKRARLTSTAALAQLRTYQTALEEHFSVVIMDVKGRILEVNNKFCQLAGYSEAELIGQTFEILNSGYHAPEFFAEMRQVLKSGKTWEGEICNQSKNGSRYWIRAIIFPIYSECGSVKRYVSIRTDITDIKRQSGILNVIVSNFPGGVALISNDDHIIAHNALYRDFLELPEDLFEGDRTSLKAIFRYSAQRGDYGPGNPEQLVQERLDRVSDRQEAVFEWIRPNKRILEIHRTPIAGAGYLATYIDTTERKTAEILLQQAHAQLSAFIKHAPVAVAMLDNTLRYVGHTQRWSTDFKLADDLVGQHHYDVFPDLPDRYKAVLNRCLAGATESSDEDTFEREDGTQYLLRWEVRPWRLVDGSIGGIIVLSEDISDRKQIERSLWRSANIDGLTNLANRRLFREKLSTFINVASETDGGFALGIVDVDKFKEVNDTLGHDSGDLLLAAIARRLESALGEGNLVGRLGGDEFAFIVEGAKTEADVISPMAALFNAVAEPIDLNGTPRQCSISCGITMFPADATKIADLLKYADLALYSAKANGRGCYKHFNPDLRRSLDRSIRVCREITQALEDDALCMYFQPVVNTRSKIPSGVEALLRWRHPQQGILPPGAFAEAFQDQPLSCAIGSRVLELTVKQAGAWNKARVNFGYVAINVTSADFASGTFVKNLLASLSKWGVAPRQITIEVTEGMFLGRGAEAVKQGLEEVRELGARIALDDFGTGYASLTHIKTFPIDCLKIDRSFVQDMETNRYSLSIVKAVIQLATSLDLEVVAEGVETESQRTLLGELGCSFTQGYLIAKPLPSTDITNFISQYPCG
jgi:diguanylate cyclase (GGDEF)-like protein/PAS domain S-box-containing protein